MNMRQLAPAPNTPCNTNDQRCAHPGSASIGSTCSCATTQASKRKRHAATSPAAHPHSAFASLAELRYRCRVAQPSLFREELRRAWSELRGSQQSAARAAAAVALGVFIGSQPIFGLHTLLVLGICVVLRLDGALAWVASNISNPFFATALITAEIQVGGYLLTGEVLALDPQLAANTAVWDYIGYAFVGALPVGGALAVGLGTITFVWVALKRRLWPGRQRAPYRLPDEAPAWWHAAERVAARYAPDYDHSSAQRSLFHYARVKLMMDPVTRLIADRFGDEQQVLGEVCDVGTGRGQMPIVLLELGRARAARGIDWDAPKIEAAKLAAARDPALDAAFEVGDATDAPIEPCDTVLIIDVLHYLTLEQQDALLERAAQAVRPGGRVVVREADTARGWRSWATLAEELFFTAVRFNRGARVKFRPASEIAARLESHGLASRVEPAWGRTPFANVLVIGEREAAHATRPAASSAA
jgi:2-polyprenyl-3-methyl-5-hydroxy-6-metoxy-1,4-benzoquinol methylase/uncharacterized protein (DUF2062 family)